MPPVEPAEVTIGTSIADHIQVTVQQSFGEYDEGLDSRVQFLRVEVSDVTPAIESIIAAIADTSWIHELVDELLIAGVVARAQPTIQRLTSDLRGAIDSEMVKKVGEYIVSMVARQAIADACGYRALPLAELINVQLSGNPGFDYHHERDGLILLFGEAKYVTGSNAYTSAFRQIVDHIAKQKDIKEIPDLMNYMSDGVKDGLRNSKKGYSAAFSTRGRSMDGARLIANIKRNANFQTLVRHETLLVVAVDIV